MRSSLPIAFRRAFASSEFWPSVSCADQMTLCLFSVGSGVWDENKKIPRRRRSEEEAIRPCCLLIRTWWRLEIATGRHLRDTLARTRPTGSKRGRSGTRCFCAHVSAKFPLWRKSVCVSSQNGHYAVSCSLQQADQVRVGSRCQLLFSVVATSGAATGLSSATICFGVSPGEDGSC